MAELFRPGTVHSTVASIPSPTFAVTVSPAILRRPGLKPLLLAEIVSTVGTTLTIGHPIRQTARTTSSLCKMLSCRSGSDDARIWADANGEQQVRVVTLVARGDDDRHIPRPGGGIKLLAAQFVPCE
jgi:hypothetical protein